MSDENVQPLTEVDINNLTLATEEMDIDTDADPFAFPPPVPDGTYRAKLVLSGKWTLYPKKDDPTTVGYLATSVEARLIDDGQPWDNNPVFDNFVSTMIMPSTGPWLAASCFPACRSCWGSSRNTPPTGFECSLSARKQVNQ